MKRLFPFLVALLLAACARGEVLLRPEQPVIWPPGPAPRIELLHAYHGTSSARAGRSTWQRIVDFLAGGERAALVSPCGATTLPDGRLAVVDTSQGVVHRLDLERGEHQILGPFDGRPVLIGIAAAPDGRLFVSDSAGARILVLSPRGRLVGSFGAPPELERPTGLVLDAARGRLLVADTLACRLTSYDLEGRLLGHHGRRGAGPGEFNFPVALALDGEGRVLVVDSLNHRVQVLSPELEPLSEFGVAGTGPGTFARPKGVAVDSDQNVYVVDGMFDNVQIFDLTGQLLLTFGRSGAALGELFLPTAIHIDTADRITLSDAGNSRVQVFQYHPERP